MIKLCRQYLIAYKFALLKTDSQNSSKLYGYNKIRIQTTQKYFSDEIHIVMQPPCGCRDLFCPK